MSEILIVGIADAEKGTNEIKELSGTELKAHLAAQAQAQASNEEAQAKFEEKATAKTKLLNRLGITAEEAALLVS
jgi:hypothetical protein